MRRDPADPEGAAQVLKDASRLRPTLAIVLGSGFQAVLNEVDVTRRISYAGLPGFVKTEVEGHAGEAVLGCLAGTPVLVLGGRAHYYEGHSMEQIAWPVRVLATFGIRDLLLTNAAGGINRQFRPGDFMAVTDHINWMGANPLRGASVPRLSAFVDLTDTYAVGLNRLLHRAARECGLRLRSGVYLAVSGPSYETPAEIRAFSRLGADAVGMSTVPEAIVARQCGLNVAALSCITNVAAGFGGTQVSHTEVLAIARRVGALAAQLLKKLAKFYGQRKQL